jgi:hypothetical protein
MSTKPDARSALWREDGTIWRRQEEKRRERRKERRDGSRDTAQPAEHTTHEGGR